MQVLEYKQNFIIWICVDALWTTFDGILASALLLNIHNIGNWDLPRMLIALGVFRLLVIPVWGWITPSFAEIPKMINNGKLDQFLAKPIDTQFLVSIQKFSFNHGSSLVGGIIFMTIGFRSLNIVLWPNILLGIWISLVAIILIYSVYFLTMTFSLNGQRSENLHNLFSEIFYSVGRYPRDIYVPILQRVFVSFFPIALMVTVPAQVLFGEFEPLIIVWFHILAIFFFIISRMVWKNGLKRYSSASS